MAYIGFKKLAAKTGSPALAAWIGRRKYGKKKFQKAAASGKKMKGMAPAKQKGGVIAGPGQTFEESIAESTGLGRNLATGGLASKIKKARKKYIGGAGAVKFVNGKMVNIKEKQGLRKGGLSKRVRAARKRPGGSNVGKARKTSKAGQGPFCGPSGGAPAGSYPVTNPGQWRAAKAYSRHAPNPSGIKSCADRIAKSRGWKK